MDKSNSSYITVILNNNDSRLNKEPKLIKLGKLYNY